MTETSVSEIGYEREVPVPVELYVQIVDKLLPEDKLEEVRDRKQYPAVISFKTTDGVEYHVHPREHQYWTNKIEEKKAMEELKNYKPE